MPVPVERLSGVIEWLGRPTVTRLAEVVHDSRWELDSELTETTAAFSNFGFTGNMHLHTNHITTCRAYGQA